MEEDEGIEPLRFHAPRFSGPLAGHSAASSACYVKELLVAEKRLELLHPKVLVSKTSVAPNYTTRPEMEH